jgi:hypothetical protein
VSELPPDFRDLLVELHAAGAEFVVVGGYAVGFHGYACATKDIDVLVRPSPENAERVYEALAAFGAPLAAFEVGAQDFATYDGVLHFGAPPYGADILNRIAGVTFEEAIVEAGTLDVEGRPIRVIGLDALLRAKRAAGRPKDLVDVEALERLHGRR